MHFIENMMHQRFIDIFEKWLYPKPTESFILGFFISSLLYLCYSAVLYSGGTYFAYLHLFYIPIVLSGIVFSTSGGIIVGLISSLLIGPFMPLVIADNIAQPSHSWVTRCIFFVLIGTLSGLGSAVFRAYLGTLKERYLTNSITGLPNFLGLEAIFQRRVLEVNELSLIVIDIRNLNEIGIAIGPRGIDKFLKMIAKDIANDLPENVTLGHTQASVFVLFVEGGDHVDTMIKYSQKRLKMTYTVDRIPVFAEEFIGVSSYPEHDDNFAGLFRKARMAINFGTRQAKVLAHYDNSVVDPSGDNAVLLTELKDAIENDRLNIHYQPKIDLKTGSVYGVEALARWPHPEKGDIEPSKFIPLTERTMMINPFTKWLLERTLKDMATWESNGIKMNLAVNFSMRNFHDRTIIEKMFELINRYDLDPTRIEIEVTESAFSNNMEEVIKTLHYLRARGIRISIDDFGTGQASQQYLFQLPIDAIKIDKIFVSVMTENGAAEAIVQNAISLGHQLKHVVIAEGIETQEQYDLLRRMKCDLGQGYLMSKPLPFDRLMGWLNESDYKAARAAD